MQRLSRSQLSKKYSLTTGMWRNRHDDLLDHLNDFFSIVEIKEGRYYYYEVPDELPDTITKLPRKTNKQEKIADYDTYVYDHLSEEFEPNSKARMSREAIKDFSREKYGHVSAEAVARRYVGPAMEELGEKSASPVWVDYETYKPLDKEQFDYLRHCFSDNNISEEDFTELGYDLIVTGVVPNEKLNSTKEKYDNAITQFRLKYGIRPIRTKNWRRKAKSGF